MQTKEKLTEIIKSTIVNAHGTKLGDVFHPEFVDNIVNNLVEGGVIVLPCKVGDIVYLVKKDTRAFDNAEFVVSGWELESNGDNSYWAVWRNEGNYIPLTFGDESIGKTVFLSYEEAEKALKGGEGE